MPCCLWATEGKTKAEGHGVAPARLLVGNLKRKEAKPGALRRPVGEPAATSSAVAAGQPKAPLKSIARETISAHHFHTSLHNQLPSHKRDHQIRGLQSAYLSALKASDNHG